MASAMTVASVSPRQLASPTVGPRAVSVKSGQLMLSKSSFFAGDACLTSATQKRAHVAVVKKNAGRQIKAAASSGPVEVSPSARRGGTVFTLDDWKRHRTSSRYFRHLRTLVSSKVITSLRDPVGYVTFIACLIEAWNECLVLAPGLLPEGAPLLHINPLPISLTGPALSLLLVFRTNGSYGRFVDARKIWGLMLNRTRDIGRQTISYVGRGNNTRDIPRRDQVLRHMSAFPIVCRYHLVPDGDLKTELLELTKLTVVEVNSLLEAKHRPNYILMLVSECLRRCYIDPALRIVMDQNLTTFADVVGGSERIFKEPIPLSYTRLTSRFLVVWLSLLPLALWDTCGLLTVPATCLSAAALFCIDEVGVLIEEPFSMLALSAIAESARNNVAEMAAMHDAIQKQISEDLPGSSPPSLPAEVNSYLPPVSPFTHAEGTPQETSRTVIEAMKH